MCVFVNYIAERNAVAELQKAVSAAESKASELVAVERAKMERVLTEARRQAAEDALSTINRQEDNTEVITLLLCFSLFSFSEIGAKLYKRDFHLTKALLFAC